MKTKFKKLIFLILLIKSLQISSQLIKIECNIDNRIQPHITTCFNIKIFKPNVQLDIKINGDSTQINILVIRRQKMFYIPIDFARYFSGLTDLTITSSNLKSLSNEVGWFTQLIKLDLSDNDITSLSANLFQSNYKLRELRINGNRINFIDKNAFSGLEQLIYLDLQENFCYLGVASNIERVKRLIDLAKFSCSMDFNQLLIDLNGNQRTIRENMAEADTKIQYIRYEFNGLNNAHNDLKTDLQSTKNSLSNLNGKIIEVNEKVIKIDQIYTQNTKELWQEVQKNYKNSENVKADIWNAINVVDNKYSDQLQRSQEKINRDIENVKVGIFNVINNEISNRLNELKRKLEEQIDKNIKLVKDDFSIVNKDLNNLSDSLRKQSEKSDRNIENVKADIKNATKEIEKKLTAQSKKLNEKIEKNAAETIHNCKTNTELLNKTLITEIMKINNKTTKDIKNVNEAVDQKIESFQNSTQEISNNIASNNKTIINNSQEISTLSGKLAEMETKINDLIESCSSNRQQQASLDEKFKILLILLIFIAVSLICLILIALFLVFSKKCSNTKISTQNQQDPKTIQPEQEYQELDMTSFNRQPETSNTQRMTTQKSLDSTYSYPSPYEELNIQPQEPLYEAHDGEGEIYEVLKNDEEDFYSEVVKPKDSSENEQSPPIYSVVNKP